MSPSERRPPGGGPRPGPRPPRPARAGPGGGPASVPCPSCGRAYDAARFAGGRSVQCACGGRVGQRLRTGLLEGPDRPRFLADVMLGGLARWLRALGYDTAWEPEIEDAALVRRALEERRLLLTRDRRLAAEWWVEGIVLLRAERPLDQLREVAAVVPLSRERSFSLCTRCNLPLRPLPPERAAGRVPQAVAEEAEPLHHCTGCERVYWQGGHTDRMRRSLDRALAPPADEEAR